MLSSYRCASPDTDSDQQRVGIASFLGLFGITTAISIVCLLLFVVRGIAPDSTSDVSNDMGKKSGC